MPTIVRSVESVLALAQTVVAETFTPYNIYGSLEEANAYFGSLLEGQRWAYTDLLRRRQALNSATQRIDRLNFIGSMASPAQPLQFPRGTDTLVPEDIKKATYWLALALLKGVDPDTERDNLGVIVQAYGGLRTEYDRTSIPAYVSAGIPCPTAWNFLQPYLDPKLGIRLERVS
jgi:hypothetical protein